MKYLSFDLEATGLAEKDLIIEFAMVPFCAETKSIEHNLSKHFYIKCPTFEDLKPKLNPWVIENNETLIRTANKEGISLPEFKKELVNWLTSPEVKDYFALPKDKKITLFGKSLNAIDLPFLNRDLGYDFMRTYFHHQTLDLSSIVMSMVDMKKIPDECLTGSKLSHYCNIGDVAHTALEDAINTAKIYFELLKIT